MDEAEPAGPVLAAPAGGRALAVVGASGGCGATTVTAAVGAAAARAGLSCCAVDLQVGGGGLDVPYAVEHLPGLRWSDLAAVEGPVDGSALVARLPAAGGVRVLAHSRDHAPLPGGDVVGQVLAGVRGSVSLVVADVPRGLPEPLLRHFDSAVVLSGDGVLELSALTATARRVSAAVDDTVLVLRGRRSLRALDEELSGGLGLPVVGWLLEDRRVPHRLRRGEGPRGDGPVARLAADLLAFAGSGVLG